MKKEIPSQFVQLGGGSVALGNKFLLPCDLLGYRDNESPVHIDHVDAFLLSKYCVTNKEYEQFDPDHRRCATSSLDKSPVTEVTYSEAQRYISWLSQRDGLPYTLPTEQEWTYAAASYGWHFSYKKGPKPVSGNVNTHSYGLHQTLEVDDARVPENVHGLLHMCGNIQEMMEGVYPTVGHNGFSTDGHYYICKGGDFGHCDFSARISTRGICDISSRCTRTGFRLAIRS